MSTPARRRLMRDFKRLQKDPPGGVSGAPCSDNIMVWNAVIFGCVPWVSSALSLCLSVLVTTAVGLRPQAKFHCFVFWPIPDDVGMRRPADTPFEDGTFKLILEFDETYPSKPPQVRFLSKMFHPNVYQDGKLCLDILQNRWSPTYDVAAILTSIQSLLHDPNPNSPANVEAANLYTENRKEYQRRVRETVETSWKE